MHEEVVTEISLLELRSDLAKIAVTATPKRVLSCLTKILVKRTGRKVAAYLYDYSGLPELIDESSLPKASRGTLSYPARGQARPDTILPLVVDGEDFGGIVFPDGVELSPDMSTLVDLYRHEASQILYVLWLRKSVKHAAANAEALHTIRRATLGTLDFSKVTMTLLEHSRKYFNVDAVALLLSDTDSNYAMIYKSIGLSAEFVANYR